MSKIAKKRKRLNIISNVYAFLVYALLYIPVAVMMVFSFNDQKYNYYWNGFTTQWYAKLFNQFYIGGQFDLQFDHCGTEYSDFRIYRYHRCPRFEAV